LSEFRPKCPACGSVLKKAKKGYLCPKPKCSVIEVHFNRYRRAVKVVHEGFSGVAFGGKKKE